MKRGLPPEEIIVRIKKALKRDGTHSWDDLVARIKDGSANIFWSEHGAWVTELVPFPQKKLLNVWVVAGELPEVMDLQPQVLAFAKEHGCASVYATARKGWKFVAQEHGWHEHAVVITHEV